jgi:hypothetical protein
MMSTPAAAELRRLLGLADPDGVNRYLAVDLDVMGEAGSSNKADLRS